MRLMRILVMFDLPVRTKQDKKNYAQFRKFLIDDGFTMMQFSIYSRVVVGLDGAQTHLNRIKRNIPPTGHIRAMTITEKQYESMIFLVGEPSTQEKTVGSQLQLVF